MVLLLEDDVDKMVGFRIVVVVVVVVGPFEFISERKKIQTPTHQQKHRHKKENNRTKHSNVQNSQQQL